jgi:hypothetical protein
MTKQDGKETITELENLALHVGFTVSNWSKIEMRLAIILARILQLPEKTGADLYNKINSFDKALHIIDVTLRHRLHGKPEADYWQDLHAYILELAEDVRAISQTPITEDNGDAYGIDTDRVPVVGAYPKWFKDEPVRLLRNFGEVSQVNQDVIYIGRLLFTFTKHLTGNEPSPDIFQNPLKRRRTSRRERLAKTRQAN